MKILSIPLCLFLIFAQLPFPGQEPEKPKEPESPVKGWWLVSYFAVPPTQYSRAGKGVIKAESLGTRASLFKKAGEKERKHPILSWGWKVSNVVRSAIETREDRFDAAAPGVGVFGKRGGVGVGGGGANGGK